MRLQLPLTIEILGLKDGEAVVVDRVIGATVYLEEAKRIGQHLQVAGLDHTGRLGRGARPNFNQRRLADPGYARGSAFAP